MTDEFRSAIDVIAIWKPLSVLVLTSLALMGSPGPATLSLAAMGAAFGSRRAIPYLIGIISGTTMVLVAVATGLTGVILAIPSLAPVLIFLAALFILYLAYQIATAPPLATRDTASSPPSFAGGLFLAVVNPKAWRGEGEGVWLGMAAFWADLSLRCRSPAAG